MAESSDGEKGPPPLPKRPASIRAQLPVSQQSNGAINVLPVPARPVPPVHANRPPVPGHGPKANLASTQLQSNRNSHNFKSNDEIKHVSTPPKPVSKSSVRKRPEITIVGARPMNEVSFRSESSVLPTSSSKFNSNTGSGEEAPPLPKRESSLEPEPKNQHARPDPPIPNKPLPPAPSKTKFPLRPSLPPKAKVKQKTKPEEGLLIDFSDEIQAPSLQPIIAHSASSPASPKHQRLYPVIDCNTTDTTKVHSPIQTSPHSVHKNQRNDDNFVVPSLIPTHPVPAARSKSPMQHPPVPPKNLPLLQNKPVPAVKPRTTPDVNKAFDYIPPEDKQPDKPKRPTIIRANKLKDSIADNGEASNVPPTIKPKPPTPTASKRLNISNVNVSDNVDEPPEYAVIVKPPKKSSVSSVSEEAVEEDDGPPPLPPKLFEPTSSPKPTVLPKPRTSIIIPQNAKLIEDPILDIPETKVKNNKTKPTIIRPPPKPLRLHEIETNVVAEQEQESEHTNSDISNVGSRKSSLNMAEKENDRKPPPRPLSRAPGAGSMSIENTGKTPPRVDRKTDITIGSIKSPDTPIKDNLPFEKAPPRPKPPSPKQRTSPVEESSVEKRPSRPGGPPPRPVSAAPVFSYERNKPSRPQPPRPGPPKLAEKPSGPPSYPPRPTPSHQLYHYILTYPHGIAEHNYTASNEDEISFKEGDTIILTGRSDSQWLKGKIGEKEGIFPERFIEIIHPLHSEYPEPKVSPDFSGRKSDWENPDWGDGEDLGGDDSSPSSKSASSRDLTNPDWEEDDTDTGTGPRCRARFDFESDCKDDLKFDEGQIIKLLEHVGTEWLRGEFDNKVGLFPISFVEIIEDVPVEMGSKESTNIATTVFDFDGLDEELSFQAGDKVLVLSEVNSEWLYGEKDGKRGKFPATFIDHIPSNLAQYTPSISTGSVINNSKDDTIQVSSVLYTVTAVYDYTSDEVGDLCFRTGDQIEILEEVGDWLKGRHNNDEGIFPKSFIEVNNTGSIGDDVQKQLAKALFDFNGEHEKELTFKKDDVITLGDVVDGSSDWQWGNLHGQNGIFPANYVQVL